MNIRLRLKADTRFSNTQTRDHLIQRCCVTSWLLTQVFTYFSLAELIWHNAGYWVTPLWKLNNRPATCMLHIQLYNSQCGSPDREREREHLRVRVKHRFHFTQFPVSFFSVAQYKAFNAEFLCEKGLHHRGVQVFRACFNSNWSSVFPLITYNSLFFMASP